MRRYGIGTALFVLGVIGGIFLSRALEKPVEAPAPVACMPPAPETAPRKPAAIVREPSGFGPPIFRQAGTLQSTLEGYLLVRWVPVDKAAKYHVEVQNEAGKIVRNFVTPHNYTYIRDLGVDPDLGETPYRVQVVPIGAGDESGQPSEWKHMVMLPMKDLAPPTIKSITTED